MQSGKGGEPPYVAGRSDEKSTVSPRTTQNGRGEMKLKMKKNEKRMNKKKKKKKRNQITVQRVTGDNKIAT